MSAKAGSAASIVVGIIAIIAAIPTGGGSLSALATLQSGLTILGGAAMIGVGIYGLAFQPKARNADSTKSQDLQYASAAEGVPLPVIFGEQRVVGNFMNYTVDNFRSKTVQGRSAGGKGADSGPAYTVGYDYFLTYEYGLCVGPIDEVVQVYSAPGEILMMGDGVSALVYSGSETYKEINLDSLDPSSSVGAETGLVRLYRGTPSQDRLLASDPYVYATALASGNLKIGYQYRIEVQTSVDFTAYGAASNAIGTLFTCNNSSGNVLTVNDAVTEYQCLNYRNICWALFMDFKIGRFPAPKSYHFVLRRFPAHDSGYNLNRPDGTTISGFPVRGSADNLKPCYNDANPAAILYECYTNKVWGLGLDQSVIDEASWKTCALFFASNNIGMSFTLDTADKIGNIIDSVRSHCKLVMTYDGETLKLRCLLDLAQTHASIQTLTKADYSRITPTRPVWTSTANDLRIEFQNRNRNYRSDSVQVRDVGHYQLTGRRNVERVALNGFSDYNTARRQAFRILRERSYPLAAFEITMNRFHSQIEVGDVIRVLVGEIEQDGTLWLMIMDIKGSDSDSDDIQILAVEDQVFKMRTGTVATPTPPSTMPWQQIEDVDEGEVGLWTGQPEIVPSGDYPAVVFELPPILAFRIYGSTARGLIAVLAQQPAVYHSAIYTYVSGVTDGTYRLLSHVRTSWAIAGELNADYDVNNYLDRQTGFTFSLFDPVKDEAELLSLFSEVDTFDQNMETIMRTNGPFVVIDGEMLHVGKVDKLGTNSYRARNVARGRFGTKISRRLDGTRIMFTESISDKTIPLYDDAGNTLSGNGFNRDVFFKFAAISRNSALSINLNNDTPVQIPHFTSNPDSEDQNGWFLRESDSPLALEFYDVTDAGSTWTIRARLRKRSVGMETSGAFFSNQELFNIATGKGTLEFLVYVRDDDTFPSTQPWYQVLVGDTSDTYDPATGLLTISSIPKTYQLQSFPAASVYDVTRIMVVTIENGSTFNGMRSVEDLIVKV